MREKDQRYWISRKKIRKLIESLITRRVRKQEKNEEGEYCGEMRLLNEEGEKESD